MSRKRLTGEERKAQIVEVAKHLFAQQGFEGTSTRDIARAAGISETMIFKHFPSKKLLYQAILDSVACGRKYSIEDKLYYTDYKLKDVLRNLVIMMLEDYEKDPLILKLLLHSGLESNLLAHEIFSEHKKRLIDYVAYEISEATKKGLFRKVDPELAAQAFMGMLTDYALSRTILQRPEYRNKPIKQVADAFVQMFFEGICKDRNPEMCRN
jgi:AcrR family transcriptional regulator